MNVEEISRAICRRSIGKNTSDILRPCRLDNSSTDRLIAAYKHMIDSCRGGDTDWSGGGNPHRIMEDMEQRYAEDAFCETCHALNLDSGLVRQAFSDARVSLSREGRCPDW